MRLYPNPVSDVLTIENLTGKTLEIVNALGQVVLQKDLENGQNLSNLTLGMGHLPKGIYFIKTADDVRRFVKN